MTDERVVPTPPREGSGTEETVDHASTLRLLTEGSLDITGRLVIASNATFLGEVSLDGSTAECVYKPIRGERPLWDFPDGALAHRERAAYLVAEHSGWDVVPLTILRDGPLGPGMCQLWIRPEGEGDEEGEAEDQELVDVVPAGEVPDGWLRVLDAYDGDGNEVSLVHADDERLARLAVFDVVVNNADRKAGHVLQGPDGRLYGVDHGISLHEEPKLRTVLWGWAGRPLPADALERLERLRSELDGSLAAELAALLTPRELEALRERTDLLRRSGRFPTPSGERPMIPWPVW